MIMKQLYVRFVYNYRYKASFMKKKESDSLYSQDISGPRESRHVV